VFDKFPIFLSVADVLEFHAELVKNFGGDSGVLDLGLLESAVAQPRQTFKGQFLHEDLAAMAAAYLFHIVKNHPFADGNKRTATHTAHVFLLLNGVNIKLPTSAMETAVLKVTQGTMSKRKLAENFRALMK
jgi:death-on-curing protein